MREIAQRKLRSGSSGDTKGRTKSGVLVAESQMACDSRPASATDRQGVLSRQPVPAPSEKNTLQVSPGRDEVAVDSPPAPKACPADSRADSSSTSTACTMYTNPTPRMPLPAQSAGVQPSTETAAGRHPRCASPEETNKGEGEGSRSTEFHGSVPLRSEIKRRFEQEVKEGSACPWEGQDGRHPRCESPEGTTKREGEGSRSAEVDGLEPLRSARKRSFEQEAKEGAARPWEGRGGRHPRSASSEETTKGEGEGSGSTEVDGSEPLRSERKKTFEQEAKEDSACPWEGHGGRRPRCASPEKTSKREGEGSRLTEVDESEPLRYARKRSFEQEAKEGAAYPWEGRDTTKDSCAPPNDARGGATVVAPLSVTSDDSAERRIKAPRLKNTLEASDVSADDVKAVLGGRKSFLRVRVCDQLQQAGTMAGKGEIRC